MPWKRTDTTCSILGATTEETSRGDFVTFLATSCVFLSAFTGSYMLLRNRLGSPPSKRCSLQSLGTPRSFAAATTRKVRAMSEVPVDVCMHCNMEYALSPETAQLSIFIKNQHCNNVLAICPHCQGVTRIFVNIESTCGLLDKMPILVYQEPSEETLTGWKNVNMPEPRQEDEVFVSDRELKKLARDLEAFEHGVDG